MQPAAPQAMYTWLLMFGSIHAVGFIVPIGHFASLKE